MSTGEKSAPLLFLNLEGAQRLFPDDVMSPTYPRLTPSVGWNGYALYRQGRAHQCAGTQHSETSVHKKTVTQRPAPSGRGDVEHCERSCPLLFCSLGIFEHLEEAAGEIVHPQLAYFQESFESP